MTDLSPERWERIDTLFAQAIERPADERTAFLRHACGNDPALYHAVEALIALEAEAAQVLGESATEFAAPLMPAVEAELAAALEDDLPPGSRIGPYRLVRVLGRGGMGRVYLAERADDQYRQQVALKLVKRGMDTDEILRRFRYERQILASLEHPNVGRLYDGGVTDDGRPYLVMEYVDGEPLTAYCDARRLDVDERLALFQTVCGAIQYAHQNLVVHRDLKPSNILVTAEGQVKLLDFGIAKLLTSEPDPAAPQTRPGVHVLTPEYASPEQLRGEPATTAADVFALGVLLHELLTGERPSTHAAHLSGGEERLPSPSTVVGNDVESAAKRATTPERLRRRLRGDLDTILLKALHPTTGRRYASVETLHDDLHRHLSGLPVHARPDALSYRTRKFVGRHRAGLSAAAVVAAMLIAFAAFYTVRVAQERDIARQERDKAQQAVAFLEGLFQASDPFAPHDEPLDSLHVRDFIDRGTAKVRRDLADQPVLRTQMLHTLGTVYFNLGLYDKAESLLRESLAMRRQVLGNDQPDVAASLFTLGTLMTARGTLDEAKALLQEALTVQHRSLGVEHPEVARTLNRLAELTRRQNDVGAADSLGRAALAIQRRTLGTHEQTARTLDNLGLLQMQQGAFDQAEPLLREALTMRRQVLGDEHPDVAASLNNLAGLTYNQGDLDGAVDLLRQALDVMHAALGQVHPDVAAGLNNLAGLLMRLERYEEAEPLFRQSLELHRTLLGETHPRVARNLHNLGWLLRQKGDPAAAEPLLRDALTLRRQALGDEHPDVARTLNNLGLVLMDQNQLTAAEEMLLASDAIRRATFPATHPDVVNSARNLAHLLQRQRRYAEAEALLLRGAEALDGEPQQAAQLQRVHQALVTLYEAWGRPNQAAAFHALSSPP